MTRVAKLRKRVHRSRTFRVLGVRGAVTVALGAALSLGGLTDAVSDVHFRVEKNLDSVEILRHTPRHHRAVVAKLPDGIAANTIFKLSQLLPERLVTRKISLFDDEWLPVRQKIASLKPAEEPKHRDVFVEELAKINQAIREEFFSNQVPYGDIIHEKAAKYDVDPALVAAVIEQESKFHSNARSNVGARGLMQLMPRTGRWMGARDLYDPEQNVEAGVRYIKYLQGRFDGNLTKTIAAYNAGEGNVLRYRGVPPFRETQQYVSKVMHNYNRRHRELQEFQDRTAGLGR